MKAARPPSEGHKLKRKVIYVYEKDNSNEENAGNKYKSNEPQVNSNDYYNYNDRPGSIQNKS